jgi:hypothetical protein
LLLVPVKNDHPTTFRLPEAVPRDNPGDIRLCESFCGQGAMGKALLASGGGELVVYAESDPWCRDHLARVFPGAKALHDHRQVSARVRVGRGLILKGSVLKVQPPAAAASVPGMPPAGLAGFPLQSRGYGQAWQPPPRRSNLTYRSHGSDAADLI